MFTRKHVVFTTRKCCCAQFCSQESLQQSIVAHKCASKHQRVLDQHSVQKSLTMTPEWELSSHNPASDVSIQYLPHAPKEHMKQVSSHMLLFEMRVSNNTTFGFGPLV